MLTFITGPVRAGKSRLAEHLALASGRRVTYCATAALADDPEWSARIAAHRASRPGDWELVETAQPGGDLVERLGSADSTLCLVVESLGTWIADRMDKRAPFFAGDTVGLQRAVEEETERLVGALLACTAHAIVVSEEVGWGVVPEYPAGRIFRDVIGRANQTLAGAAERAYLVVCGVALDLKKALPFDRL